MSETHQSPAAPQSARIARDELVSAGCQVMLEESEKSKDGTRAPGLRVQPSSAAALGRAVSLLYARRMPVRVRGASDAPLGPVAGGALLDLSALDRIASIDPISLLARVEAGCSLAALETAARRANCTLGPLLPAVRSGSVGAWLAGPTRGERGVPPSRRETAALSVTALLRDGHVAESRQAPRSASGPDLDHLALGGGGLLCVIASATIRLLPAAEILAAAWRLPSLVHAALALEQLSLQPFTPSRARLLSLEPGRGALLAAAWEGPLTARLDRARALRHLALEPALDIGDPAIWVRGAIEPQSVEVDAQFRDLHAWAAGEILVGEVAGQHRSEVRLVGLHAGGAFAVLTSAGAARAEECAVAAAQAGMRVLWPRHLRDSGAFWEAEGATGAWSRLRAALGTEEPL